MATPRRQTAPTASAVTSSPSTIDKIAYHSVTGADRKEDAAFADFGKLPVELQGLIWEWAFASAPSIVEAVYNDDFDHFEVSGPTSTILSVCGPDFLPKYFSPIYLYHRRHLQDIEQIFYIRPKTDVLYLFLRELCISKFLECPENQVLEHMAFTSLEAAPLQCTRPRGYLNSMDLVRGLKLKTLYVLDGDFKGDENTREGRLIGDIRLVELEDVPPLQVDPYHGYSWPGSNYASRTFVPILWTLELLKDLETKFKERVKRITGWEAPKIIGKTVIREGDNDLL